MEIEINFRLDETGRTASTTVIQTEDFAGASASENGSSPSSAHLDYSYRVIMTNLQNRSNNSDGKTDTESPEQYQQWLDDILFDCEISDSGLMPRTFWVPAQGFKPRCALEQFAFDVFHHHVPKDLHYDVANSGAEWWCQLRPSPEKTGRYAMHCPTDENDTESASNPAQDPFSQGISMHVDKDEELRILTGGTTYIHPHLSTVTYLTNFGSPTMIMNIRVHPLEGTWMVPSETMEGFVSWPALGKHTSFDGRFLHAAPCDLMEHGTFEKQIHFQPVENDARKNKLLARRHRRVTFLVNIWLNHHPFDVNPFPDTMVDKMSGQKESDRRPLFSEAEPNSSISPASHVQKVCVRSTTATEQEHQNGGEKDETNDTTTKFVWSLGDKSSNERLELQMPLGSIRKEGSQSGNVSITWNSDAKMERQPSFQLYLEQDNTISSECDAKNEAGDSSNDDGLKDSTQVEMRRERIKRARLDACQ
jgi:hypothetical protein